MTMQEAMHAIVGEFKGAWDRMVGQEDIDRWKRTDQYRREIRQGLHKPNIIDD